MHIATIAIQTVMFIFSKVGLLREQVVQFGKLSHILYKDPKGRELCVELTHGFFLNDTFIMRKARK